MKFTKRIASIAVAATTAISLCGGQIQPITVEANTELDHITYCPIQTFTEYVMSVLYIGGPVIHDYINGVPVEVVQWKASEYYPELTNIDIPDTMRAIWDDFSETALVKSQTGVKYADNWVVDCDTDVTTAVIREGTVGIAESAFADCENLESIEIPDSVKYVNCNFEDTALIKNQSGPVYYADNWVVDCDADSVTSIEVRDGTIGIADKAFEEYKTEYDSDTDSRVEYFNSKIEHIDLPDSVKYIGIAAMNFNKNLKEVTLPANLEYLGRSAFQSCNNLEKITISEGLEIIEPCTFYLSGIKEISLPDSLSVIGNEAFSCCENLSSINLNKVSRVNDYSFYGCTNLKNVTVPTSVTYIGDFAFYNCGFEDLGSLEKIVIENPECEIYDDEYTISETATIYGYKNSTAQAYAEKYDRKFVALDEEPEVTTTVTTPAVTTTTTTTVTTTAPVETSTTAGVTTPAVTTTVTTDESTATTTTITKLLLGDANLDGKVNVRDCAHIAYMLANGMAYLLPENADYNQDSKKNVRDAAAIARYLAG